ncbi:MAG: antibiotic biosynthesis monooxygenase, partial [Mycobacterium sp.]
SERRQLLADGKKFRDFKIRTVDHSFGSWFAFDDARSEAPPPSETKTSIAVWVGLYPTVVLLTLALSPLRMPLWLGMLIGNLLSSVLISFVVMPYYVNPLLAQWLRPPAGSRRRANIRGMAIIVAVMAAWTVVFYLVTEVFWHLP